MGLYLLRRLGAAVVTVFLASIVVFAGIQALPGDAALALAGEERSPAVLVQIRHEYGLDRPLPIQYLHYIGQALQGNLGQSTRIGAQVSTILGQRLPVTLELSVLAIALGILIGIPAGILSALKRGRVADYGANAFALVGLSVPHFWLGLLLILAFSVNLHLLPASGFVPLLTDPGGNLLRMVLPAIVLGTGLSAVLMRQMRSAMLESLSADYVRTARSKGIAEWRVVGIHALRNSLITVVTVLGLQLGALISGAVITEQIFVIPGFGKLIVDAIFQRDYPVIEGVTLITVVGYVVVNLFVDLTYSFLNPRIRVSGASS